MKKYNVYVSTDPGKVRANNEDNFIINSTFRNPEQKKQHLKGSSLPEPILCGVFDGMGGESAGMEASEAAAKTAVEYFKFLRKRRTFPQKTIHQYVDNSNQIIRRYMEENRLKRGGTTFALAYICEEGVQLFSMGDSRIYLYRSGVLQRVSRDHTLAQKKYEANIFTKEEAEHSAESHMLTRFLGMDPESADYKAEVYAPIELNPGEKLLICSDGLYDMCTDDEIREIIISESETPTIRLVKAALENGGEDNVTCVIVELAENNGG